MTIDKEMIFQKIIDVDVYISKLDNILPDTVDDFLDNLDTQLLGERIFEIITQTMLDICYHIIAKQKLKVPENYGDCIKSLSSLDILTTDEVKKYRMIIGMRNIIAHQYGKIDQELLYQGLKEIKDEFHRFARKIKEWISKSFDVET